MEKLSLGRYDWFHSASDYMQIWDFSKLRSLTLLESYNKFIAERDGVPPRDLFNLLSIEICRSWRFVDVPEGTVKRDLNRFLCGLKNLKKLKIECCNWHESLCIESIANHAGLTLQNIRLHDIGIGKVETIAMSDLSILQSLFPHLRHLGLDLTFNSEEFETFMKLLPDFLQVRKLELSAQTLHLASVNDNQSEAAGKVMGKLHFDKHGVRFDLITIHVGTAATKYLSVLSRLNNQDDYIQWEEENNPRKKPKVCECVENSEVEWS